jgi:hypothetical protein
MAITLEGRPKRTYPFGVFHTSSRSTYRQKMGSKRLTHLGMFPHEWDWEIRARYIPSCRTPTYQYNFFSTKNLIEKVLFDKMRCRRNVLSTTSLSTNNIAFLLSKFYFYRSNSAFSSLNQPHLLYSINILVFFYGWNSAVSALNQPPRLDSIDI